MPASHKARASGISQVALEVGDIDEALACYRAWLDVEPRGRSDSMAFIDLVDYATLQFARAHGVPRGMGLEDLGKHDEALAALAQEGMAPGSGDRARDWTSARRAA